MYNQPFYTYPQYYGGQYPQSNIMQGSTNQQVPGNMMAQPIPANVPAGQNANGMVKGRIVSSVDEVKASQIDLDGSISYFPCPAQNAIYTKSISMQGLPVIEVFKLAEPEKAPEYASVDDFAQLVSKVNELEASLKNESTRGVKKNA